MNVSVKGSGSTGGGYNHQSPEWRRLASEFGAYCERKQLPCAIGKHPIDYRLKHPHRDAFQADHKIPAAIRPDLFLVWSNLQPSCCRCNTAKRHKPTTETEWVKPPW